MNTEQQILKQAAQTISRAQSCLMRLDAALINFDHRQAEREIGNLQEELRTLKELITEAQ